MSVILPLERMIRAYEIEDGKRYLGRLKSEPNNPILTPFFISEGVNGKLVVYGASDNTYSFYQFLELYELPIPKDNQTPCS